MVEAKASELQAAATLFAGFCTDPAIAYYEQKKQDPHPLACEQASKDVTQCWSALRAKIKATSEESFHSYAKCLEDTGNDLKRCADLEDALVKSFAGTRQ